MARMRLGLIRNIPPDYDLTGDGDKQLNAFVLAFLNDILAPGGRAERKAREALTKILLDFDRPLPTDLRKALADLFDPKPWPSAAMEYEPRDAKETQATKIAIHIVRQQLAGSKWRLAVDSARTRFDVSRATVTRAWRDAREFAEKYVATGLPD